jgi:hypothetical protein
MYNKRVITKDTIVGMTPNMCIQLFQEQQREIERLTRLVEKQGKKCNKYQRMLAAAHFGGEDKIPRKEKPSPCFAGSKGNAYHAWYENGEIVIHYGLYEPYRGEYKGDDTPYMNDIKKEQIRLYNSIVKFFADKK